MNAFFWSAGHLGWGIFALIVYTGVCCLLADLAWRLVTAPARRLFAVMGALWLAGAALIVLAACWMAT